MLVYLIIVFQKFAQFDGFCSFSRGVSMLSSWIMPSKLSLIIFCCSVCEKDETPHYWDAEWLYVKLLLPLREYILHNGPLQNRQKSLSFKDVAEFSQGWSLKLLKITGSLQVVLCLILVLRLSISLWKQHTWQPQFICQTEAHTNDHSRGDGTDGCRLLRWQIFQRRERTIQRTHLSQRCVWLPVFVLNVCVCVCVCVFMHVCVRWEVHLQSCMQHRSPSSPASTEVYLGSGGEHTHVYTGGLNP